MTYNLMKGHLTHEHFLLGPAKGVSRTSYHRPDQLQKGIFMSHRPLQLKAVSLSFPDKTCFQRFSTDIHPGSKIALIGPNGSGKSSLLGIIGGTVRPDSGSLDVPQEVRIVSVPQHPAGDTLSGAERFQRALTQALAEHPNILLLDEPTNHLDQQARRNLIRMLDGWHETLIIVSHDTELLRAIPTELWHFTDQRIEVYKGGYDAFIQEQALTAERARTTLTTLQKEHKKLRRSVEEEKRKRARRAHVNRNENDRSLKGRMKESASASSGSYERKIASREEKIQEHSKLTNIPRTIRPTFHLQGNLTKHSTISIQDGSCGYQKPLIEAINLHIPFGERIAIRGSNGSGKSTFLKALMEDPTVTRTGLWSAPDRKGYFDQTYKTLVSSETVLSTLEACTPLWDAHARRAFLASFLFRTHAEVATPVSHLSGGEKARLCLAHIAATNPPLLLIDEITNNLDRETKAHVLSVLNDYEGTLLIISHEEEFLEELALDRQFIVHKGTIDEL